MPFQTTFIQGKTNHIDKDLLSLATDLFDGNSCVIGSNDFLVEQNSPVGMSVRVRGGVIHSYIASNSTYYRHKLTDTYTTLNIDSNSSG